MLACAYQKEHFDALSLSSLQEWSNAEPIHALPFSFSRAWNNEDSCFPDVHQSSPRKKLT